MAESKIDIDRFLALSTVLTGTAKLDPTLAEAYLARLRDAFPAPPAPPVPPAPPAPTMADVLTAFAAVEKDEHLVFEVKRRIVEDKVLGALAQKIIFIWYTSEFVGADGKPKTGTQEQFYSGLLWKVIRAHAPTNSKLKYGDWINPPAAH
jgi:hypothetical protein